MQNPNQQPQPINVNPNDTTEIKCACGSLVFQECFMMRRISAILSPTGREEQFQIPVPVCIACGRPFMGEEPTEATQEESKVVQ